MSMLAGWLMAMVGPMVMRAIIAAGFTAITFAGVTALVNTLVGQAQAGWQSLPTTTLQLASLLGLPEVLGMIFGAYVACIALKQAQGMTKYVLKSPK